MCGFYALFAYILIEKIINNVDRENEITVIIIIFDGTKKNYQKIFRVTTIYEHEHSVFIIWSSNTTRKKLNTILGNVFHCFDHTTHSFIQYGMLWSLFCYFHFVLCIIFAKNSMYLSVLYMHGMENTFRLLNRIAYNHLMSCLRCSAVILFLVSCVYLSSPILLSHLNMYGKLWCWCLHVFYVNVCRFAMHNFSHHYNQSRGKKTRRWKN